MKHTLQKTLSKLCYDRAGVYRFSILHHKLFLTGLVIKLLAAAVFTGAFFTESFVPFVKYSIITGTNPYSYFVAIESLLAFPYPKLMLSILALPGLLIEPLLSLPIWSVSALERLVFHLPLLIADIGILLILARWLKGKDKLLLWHYWLSPVLLYITYIHSQLDIIPIGLLLAFLFLLFKEYWRSAFIILGAALATKFHIAIVLPLVAVYLWRQRPQWLFVGSLILTSLTTFLLINLNYLFTPAFQQLVFQNDEQAKVFDLQLSLGDETLIYIVPFMYILLVLYTFTFRFLSRELFVMLLGFGFGLLLFFVPPGPGWYFWIIPFLVYFYTKYPDSPRAPLHLLSLAYLLYFALIPDSDYFLVFSAIAPSIAGLGTPAALLTDLGLPARDLHHIAFTILQATLFVNLVWLYRRGIAHSNQSKLHNSPYLIGIAGDSGSGKTTLAASLTNLFSQRYTTVITGDDMHKWERGDTNWQTYTHLDPRANTLHEESEQARALERGEIIYRRHYDHSTGRFTPPRKLRSQKVLIFEGLHSLFLTSMRQALDLKIFINPDENLRIHWKLQRDMKKRGHAKEKILEQIKQRIADARTYIATQRPHADVSFTLKTINTLTEDELGSEQTFSTKLSISCVNTIDLELFMSALSEHTTITHHYDADTQHIEITGTVDTAIIEQLSFALTPELYDIFPSEPVWDEGYTGLMQLFVCYYIFKTLPQ